MGVEQVVISNVFADDNRGGAAITGATIESVRQAYPAARITLVAVGPNAERLNTTHRHTIRRFPDVEILPSAIPVTSSRFAAPWALLMSIVALLLPNRRANPAMTRLADADLVVSKGGHVFVEREGLRAVFGLWLTAWPLVYARRLGIPTVAFCHTIGPFQTRTSRWLCASILRRVTLVLARDPFSHAVALDVGVPRERVVEVPDSVFRTPPPTPEHSGHITEQLGFGEATFGVFTIRSRKVGEERRDFLRRLTNTIHAVLDRELVGQIALVVQVDGLTASDAKDAFEVAALVDDRRVTIVRADLAPDELIAFYSRARFLVGCRMHSAIFSLIAGTPAIAVALAGEKVRGVYESLGLSQFVIAADAVSSDNLADLLAEIVAAGPELREQVISAVAHARERTHDYPALLRRSVQ